MTVLTTTMYEATTKIDHVNNNSSKQYKFSKFVDIALGVSLALGISAGVVSVNHYQHTIAQEQQTHLASIAEKPLVFEDGQLGACNLGYIQTAHAEKSGSFEPELYFQTTCGNSVMISKVKENINLSRMKLSNVPLSDTSLRQIKYLKDKI